MRQVKKIIQAQIKKFSELTKQEQKLLYLAAEARLKAQTPYSHYCVGAAILTEDGKMYKGCNVERCTYTQTTHAEQNAIDTMVTEQGSTKIKIVVVVAGPEGIPINIPPKKKGKSIKAIDERICVPCGHCLQIVWENCMVDPKVKLIGLADNGEITSTTIGDAFPMRFGPESLKIDYRKNKKLE